MLGPGSDGYHENHIHVDLMERRSGFRGMCQWDVRMPETTPPPEVVSAVPEVVPLPQPRPKVDLPAARK